MEELSSMLWAYHSTSQATTYETPFNLVFGIELVILVKISFQILQTEYFDEWNNPTCLLLNLDLLDDTRVKAHLYMVAYQQ